MMKNESAIKSSPNEGFYGVSHISRGNYTKIALFWVG